MLWSLFLSQSSTDLPYCQWVDWDVVLVPHRSLRERPPGRRRRLSERCSPSCHSPGGKCPLLALWTDLREQPSQWRPVYSGESSPSPVHSSVGSGTACFSPSTFPTTHPLGLLSSSFFIGLQAVLFWLGDRPLTHLPTQSLHTNPRGTVGWCLAT